MGGVLLSSFYPAALTGRFRSYGEIMDHRLLEIIACPVCKGPLIYQQPYLLCQVDKLRFPIEEGIPVLLETEAQPLGVSEN